MCLLARLVITLVALLTFIGSNIADWNDTHIFSELWSPHARLHGAWFVIVLSLLSVLSLWLVWSRLEQPDRSRIAAIIQGCIWIAFFPAALVPNTTLADSGRELARIAGADLNLFGAILSVVLLAVALILLQKSRKSPL